MKRTSVFCLWILLASIPISCSQENLNNDTKIENIRTFAKLYGHVRFFHPSDRASAVDWDRFAIHGVQSVKNTTTQKELRNKLEDLFYPIAPTVQVYSSDKNPPEKKAIPTPSDTAGFKLVAWQHQGLGFGSSDIYKSIRLNRPVEDSAEPLFEQRPEAGKVVVKSLGRGLSAQIPVALYSKRGQTLRPDNAPSINPLQDSLQSVPTDTLTGASQALRYANVVIAWNVFQHFYPYFDVVDVNWDTVLSKSLQKATHDQTPAEFRNTLRWMVTRLKDGHAAAYPIQNVSDYHWLPFIVKEVEGKLMITAVSTDVKDDTCFKQGDTITSIDGEPADQWFKKKRELISGSSQWKTASALTRLRYSPSVKEVTMDLSRPGETVTCSVTYNKGRNLKTERPAPIEQVKDDIYYVDLRRTTMKAIEEKADSLSAAKGIVFDLRGYPNNTHGVLQHLSRDTLHSAHFLVPQYIYPDQTNVSYDNSGRWTLPPKNPYFSGKNVFLTNKEAISYSESVMGIVEHYNLAEIVGEPTAGANGNRNVFKLPGNYRISWTGMKVVKHDSSQHHLIGIKPTVPVERTVEGIRRGQDEYLNKALEVIESSN